MKVQRETITLSDGTKVVLRKLNQLDAWEAQKIEDDHAQLAFLMAQAVISPCLEIEGQPLEEPTVGTIHIRDLSDEDFAKLLKATNAFALGGARRKKFPKDNRPEPAADAAQSGDGLREAPARDSGAAA